MGYILPLIYELSGCVNVYCKQKIPFQRSFLFLKPLEINKGQGCAVYTSLTPCWAASRFSVVLEKGQTHTEKEYSHRA